MSQTVFTYSTGLPTNSSDTTLSQLSYDRRRDLTSVYIGTLVTSISTRCFQSCTGLTSITIPNNVMTIQTQSFDRCTGLSTVTLPTNNNFTSMGPYCFQNCTSLNAITIPDSVTTISIGVFALCSGLTTITIPPNVTSIGNQSFFGCSNLRTIIYSNPSIITIGASNAPYGSTPIMTVDFYNTPLPHPPVPATNAYNTNLYTSGSSFNYYVYSSCYNEGTLILVLKNGVEEYVKIEDLRKGDVVKTYLHGFKEIELIGKNKIINSQCTEQHSMYKINDLIVTGGHFLLVDDLSSNNLSNIDFYKNNYKIDNKYLLYVCDFMNAEKLIDNKVYNVYHLVLEGEQERYGIYVNNGILSETTPKEHFLNMKFTLL
jgi:hypothetical protein